MVSVSTTARGGFPTVKGFILELNHASESWIWAEMPTSFDRSDYQTASLGEAKTTCFGLKKATDRAKLDAILFCPLTGRCPYCKSALLSANSVGKGKLCYTIPWPKTVIGLDVKCVKCSRHFMTFDADYVATLPSGVQLKADFVTGKGNASHMSLLHLLRSGMTVAQVEKYAEAEIREHYLVLKAEYIELWDKVDALRGVGKKNIAPQDAFPP